MNREDWFDEMGQPTEEAWKFGLRVAIIMNILSWSYFILGELGVY